MKLLVPSSGSRILAEVGGDPGSNQLFGSLIGDRHGRIVPLPIDVQAALLVVLQNDLAGIARRTEGKVEPLLEGGSGGLVVVHIEAPSGVWGNEDRR